MPRCNSPRPCLKAHRLVRPAPGTEAAPNVALRDDELARISERLGREPSIVELHAFDAQWSEHCSYKSSRHHLKKLPTSGANVVLGPGEDAGILHLGVHEGERFAVVVAHESHNHPSQVVPFEGAATGIGGVVRDVLCMGAEVIAVADPFTYAVHAFKSLLLKNTGFGAISYDLMFLLIFSTIAMSAATVLFKRTL